MTDGHDNDHEPGADHPIGHLWRAPAKSFGMRAAALAGLVVAIGVGAAPAAVDLTGVFDSPAGGSVVAVTGTGCSGATK
jgi:hypothetical protein